MTDTLNVLSKRRTELLKAISALHEHVDSLSDIIYTHKWGVNKEEVNKIKGIHELIKRLERDKTFTKNRIIALKGAVEEVNYLIKIFKEELENASNEGRD